VEARAALTFLAPRGPDVVAPAAAAVAGTPIRNNHLELEHNRYEVDPCSGRMREIRYAFDNLRKIQVTPKWNEWVAVTSANAASANTYPQNEKSRKRQSS